MEKMMRNLERYMKKKKLNMNVEKTKIMVHKKREERTRGKMAVKK